MADLGSSRPTVLHPGVDAQSWLGFEQRIQSRRFDALVASAREAIAAGNVAFASHAIEEAREIRQHAPELDELEAAVQRLEWQSHGPLIWRRAAGAFMLLAAGVFLVIALDRTRITPGALPIVAPPPPPMWLPRPAIAVDRMFTIDEAEPEDVAPTVEPAVPAPRSASATTVAMDRADTASASGVDRAGSLAPARGRVAAPTRSEPERPAPPIDHSPLGRAADAPGIIAPPIVGRLTTDVPAIALTTTASAAPAPSRRVEAAAPVSAMPRDDSAEDESRVAAVLRRYARAYGDLDVSAARDVWPNVDERALARAFESLASQTVSFEQCDIDVHGATANASCRGQASYVGKVGSGALRVEPRTWQFELRRDGETWKIARAQAKRMTGSGH